MGRSDDAVPVSLGADGEHAVRLTGERVDAVGTRAVDVVGRHHDTDRLARAVALAADGGTAVLDLAHHALRVSEPGGESALVLNLALGDEADADADAADDVTPDADAARDGAASEITDKPAPDATVERG